MQSIMFLRADPLVAASRSESNNLYVFGTLHGSDTHTEGPCTNCELPPVWAKHAAASHTNLVHTKRPLIGYAVKAGRDVKATSDTVHQHQTNAIQISEKRSAAHSQLGGGLLHHNVIEVSRVN